MKQTHSTLLATVIAVVVPLTVTSATQAANFDDASLPVYSEFSIDSITAKVTKGLNLTDDPNGSLGAFSDFYYNEGVVTIDFNDPSLRKAVAHKDNTYTYGNESVVFSFDKSLGSNGTDIFSHNTWGPSGANGEKNTSEYLGVFNGNSVTIDLADDLNYFGINWGALSANNTFEFLQVDDNGAETSLGLFNYDSLFTEAGGQTDISKLPTLAAHQNQYNGYVHFYATETDGLFNRIKVSQVSTDGGGFETDNYSFRFSDQSFDFEEGTDSAQTPEPGALLGLVAFGGLVLRRHRLIA